jgi:DNA polymerase III delta prime subunit
MVMKKEHYILNEKYRPSTLEGYVCDEQFKEKIQSWIEEQNIPHLFFYGKAGSGKSTLAKILAKNIDCDYIYVNATDKRGMDDIRNEILPFVSVMSFKSAPKIVILDEATHILQASQVLLLNMIETYSLNTRFILTGNYPERLIEPLRSRLEDYNLKPPSKKSVAKHLDTILRAEGVEFDIKDVAQVIHTYYPDIRRTINNIQKYIVEDKFMLPKILTNSVDIENQIIKELSKPTPKSFPTIRQLIGDGDITDFDSLYKKIYDEIHDFGSLYEGLVIISLHEHMFQSISVIDKEICFMACVQKILDILKQ